MSVFSMGLVYRFLLKVTLRNDRSNLTEIYDCTLISGCWSLIVFVFVMSLVEWYLYRSLCTKLTAYERWGAGVEYHFQKN